eukprot:1194372-Prorocentrum_minimum.AAC.8
MKAAHAKKQSAILRWLTLLENYAPVPRDGRGHPAFQGTSGPLHRAQVQHLHIVQGPPAVDSPDDVHLLVHHHRGMLAAGKGSRRAGLDGQLYPHIRLCEAQLSRARAV